MTRATRKAAGIAVALVAGLGVAAAQEMRFAFHPSACDGEAFTRRETPLILDRLAVRWFDTDCTIVGSYKVGQALFLQVRCRTQGEVETVPLMLELRGDQLRVGWNREPVVEMQRCH